MRAVAAVWCVGLLVLSGCSTGSTEGAAVPVTTAVPPTTSVPSLPERPRSFDLTSVDPCLLMPEDRRAEWNLNQPPLGPEPVFDDPELIKCSISSSTESSFSAFLDYSRGAAEQLERADSERILRSVMVNGFEIPLLAGGDDASCIAVIDANDDQNLRVQANSTGRLTPEEACVVLEPWLPVVLDTLAQQQPA